MQCRCLIVVSILLHMYLLDEETTLSDQLLTPKEAETIVKSAVCQNLYTGCPLIHVCVKYRLSAVT